MKGIPSPSDLIRGVQYILKPAETAVFKYILTGVDDSALDVTIFCSERPPTR